MEYIKPATPRELFALRAIRLCLEAALWFMFVAAVVLYCKASGFAGDLAGDLDAMPLWRMAAMALAGCGLAEYFHAIRTPGSWLHDMLIPPTAHPGRVGGMDAGELRDAIRRALLVLRSNWNAAGPFPTDIEVRRAAHEIAVLLEMLGPCETPAKMQAECTPPPQPT